MGHPFMWYAMSDLRGPLRVRFHQQADLYRKDRHQRVMSSYDVPQIPTYVPVPYTCTSTIATHACRLVAFRFIPYAQTAGPRSRCSTPRQPHGGTRHI